MEYDRKIIREMRVSVLPPSEPRDAHGLVQSGYDATRKAMRTLRAAWKNMDDKEFEAMLEEQVDVLQGVLDRIDAFRSENQFSENLFEEEGS
jgi:hypothetical protein